MSHSFIMSRSWYPRGVKAYTTVSRPDARSVDVRLGVSSPHSCSAVRLNLASANSLPLELEKRTWLGVFNSVRLDVVTHSSSPALLDPAPRNRALAVGRVRTESAFNKSRSSFSSSGVLTAAGFAVRPDREIETPINTPTSRSTTPPDATAA